MDKEAMNDELIMAYADGEASAEDARRVEHLLEVSPEARRKLEMFQQTAEALRAAREDVPPVSEALAKRVADTLEADARSSVQGDTGTIVEFPRRGWGAVWPAAMAASIALVVGLGFGYGLNGGISGPANGPLGVTSLAEPAIGDALAVMSSGTSRVLPSGATLNVIASFEGEDGVFCREFDYETPTGLSLVSVACRNNAAWQPRIAVTVSGESGNLYAPASSLDALEAWLASSGLGEPLDETVERKHLEKE